LQTVVFEAGSKLTKLPEQLFYCCSQLLSICIPSSVEIIDRECFAQCDALLDVAFEPGSKLRRIEAGAFALSWQLASFCVPACVEYIGETCFSRCEALASLQFARPSRLRQLLDVPPQLREVAEIPDSVEMILISGDGVRDIASVLDFGRESKLDWIAHYHFEGRRRVRCFLRVSCVTLKSCRKRLEFPEGADSPGARLRQTQLVPRDDFLANLRTRMQFSGWIYRE
jgi:hypothetical protein